MRGNDARTDRSSSRGRRSKVDLVVWLLFMCVFLVLAFVDGYPHPWTDRLDAIVHTLSLFSAGLSFGMAIAEARSLRGAP